MKLPIKIIILVVVVFAIAGGALYIQKIASRPKKIALSKSDMELLLGTLPPSSLQELSSNPSERKRLVANLKQILSVGQAAEAAGYGEHKDVKPMVSFMSDSVLSGIYQEKNPDNKISPQDVQDYAKQHDKEYQQFLDSDPRLRSQAQGGQEDQIKNRFATVHLLAERARKQGIGKDRETELEIMLSKYQVLAGAYSKDLQDNSTNNVSDQDVQNYFNQHSADFDQVCAHHILIKTKSSDGPPPQAGEKPEDQGLSVEDARKKAQSVLDQIKKGGDFDALAKQFSDDPGSKGKGGDLGCFAKGQMVPEFEQAAFALQPGQVSDLVQSEFGFHIIKLDGRKKGDPNDPKTKQEIVGMVKQQKFQQKIDDIINKSKVTIAEDFQVPSKPTTAPPSGGPQGAPQGK